MFGSKKAQGKKQDSTVLVLDVESSSVASALVHLPAASAPKIVAYKREYLPLLATRNTNDIATSLEKALLHSLSYISEVAARMRTHAATAQFGTISSAAVFFAAPWGTPNLSIGKSTFVSGMREFSKEQIQAVFGDIKISFHTSADALAYGSHVLGRNNNTLITALRGELLELLLLNEAGPQAYSTVPQGSRSILRTLKTHGSMNEHEAHSMLLLAHTTDDAQYEPLVAVAHHLGETFADTAKLFLPPASTINIVVIGEHPMGEWFAKNLAKNPQVTDLFAEGSTVEALRPHHLGSLVEPTSVHDPFVLVEALFATRDGMLY